MLKKVFCIIMMLIMVFTITACYSNTDDLQNQIKELQNKITNLEKENLDLNTKVTDLELELNGLKDRTNSIEEKIKDIASPVSHTVAFMGESSFHKTCTDYGFQEIISSYNTWEQDYFEHEIYEERTLDYDERFFDENSLLYCYFTLSRSGFEVTSTKVYKCDGELIAEMNIIGGGLTMMSSGCFIIEVKKYDIKNYTTFDFYHDTSTVSSHPPVLREI